MYLHCLMCLPKTQHILNSFPPIFLSRNMIPRNFYFTYMLSFNLFTYKGTLSLILFFLILKVIASLKEMEETKTKDMFSLKFDCEGEPEGLVDHGDWFLCQDSKVNIYVSVVIILELTTCLIKSFFYKLTR